MRMSLRRHLVLSSVAAIVIGLTIILTPTLLFPSQVEYSGPTIHQLFETTAPTPTPTPKPLPRESIGQSVPPSFMFEYDLDSSHGFKRTYLAHGTFGTPVFVISRGESATIVILVSSLSNSALQVSLERIDGLPTGVNARLKPESLTLQPYEHRELELEISVSSTAPISTPRTTLTQKTETSAPTPTMTQQPTPQTPTIIPERAEPIPAEFIQIVLMGDEYSIGAGLRLRII